MLTITWLWPVLFNFTYKCGLPQTRTFLCFVFRAVMPPVDPQPPLKKCYFHQWRTYFLALLCPLWEIQICSGIWFCGKIPCGTRDLNLHQDYSWLFSQTLYQLSYIDPVLVHYWWPCLQLASSIVHEPLWPGGDKVVNRRTRVQTYLGHLFLQMPQFMDNRL